jgi:hypothetical protein
MTRNIAIATLILVATAVLPLAAQNRAETQMLLELRSLQEQVQRLQLALNQMTERVKANETAVETRANDMRKGIRRPEAADRFDHGRPPHIDGARKRKRRQSPPCSARK